MADGKNYADEGNKNYDEPYEYESDMLRSSMQEQERRRSARTAKDPEYRRWYQQRADEAHQEMTTSARLGLEARRAQRARARSSKRK